MGGTDEAAIAAVRGFTRFYTRQADLLNEGLLDSGFSLAEARVLYELANRAEATAGDLVRDLAIDAGYLSRILKRFRSAGLLSREAAPDDGRRARLTLTEMGHAAFGPLDLASREQVARLLGPLTDGRRRALLRAMAEIQEILGDAPEEGFTLGPHRPGDMGWITHRQAVLYATEYGWDDTFEALVAGITASFIRNFDPERERCWIAERRGEVVGSIFCVRESDSVAKLRLLYVEPQTRGLGIGRRLVGECIAFARATGYRTLTLWTNDILGAARKIYVEAGFKLVAEERHHSFGHDLVGQNWELAL
ncbi:bifunctional helix-turn-helix transcriptional regulator/GNAT family N-acetyltransferase [Enterovirga sp. CN4-39]|uniref:bifunctional helix-turn-helix transcriptional regulator/GNAT family N-acetyltransferase n=1 Tax=Enterovirga sp. CN4-39 TaxID=3400910 RepID=UPI003C104F91